MYFEGQGEGEGVGLRPYFLFCSDLLMLICPKSHGWLCSVVFAVMGGRWHGQLALESSDILPPAYLHIQMPHVFAVKSAPYARSRL